MIPTDRTITTAAAEVAEELAAAGAAAVCLVGSHATGAATPTSDVDIAVVGLGPEYRLELRDHLLFSIGWAPEDVQRRRLYDPDWLATHVVGWRRAVVLHDPVGIAESIRREAANWSWALVSDRCDVWVAEQVAGLAEEVRKLVSSLTSHNWLEATVQRSALARQLSMILAIHRRLLYGSENAVWQLIGDDLGSDWREAQKAALWVGDSDFKQACEASLSLFALSAREVESLMDERQRAVTASAVRAISATRRKTD